MIRILQCVNDMHRAGLETMLMNYYRNIDRDKIQFDFLTHRPNRSDYDDEIESLGGKMYYAPRLYPQNYPEYFKWMKRFFAEHPEYKIVHSHIDAMSYLPLKAAKTANIPVRIAHSHNTSKFSFIPNAIEVDKFLYNEKIRAEKRQELDIQNQFVVGHIGRLSYQKNHKLLIKIFDELQRKLPESLLLLVGVGEKEEEIRNLVCELGLESKVRFLGNRNDVNEIYQAMDVFVMPSFFEGVPVVGVEAQFSDLPCIFSDKVPSEVKFNSKTKFVSLDATIEEWVNSIWATQNSKRSSDRRELQNSQYDINVAHSILENYYLNIAAERGL